jgi:cytochrome c5
MMALAAFTLGLAGAAHAADLSKDLQYGKDRYDRYCAPCHDKGFWGAQKIGARLGEEHAVLEDRTDLNGPYIETVVRAGFGSMPPYRLTEVSPKELDAIAQYLTRKER